ncbi:MAG: aminotransferase class I/II-fold pyridoxal phosphate-dependent enzyme [Anaerolineae bacterium]|nr:aminotransferase class I/II-fold pyridoxal phosphate-dependent enzyme [Thermoflexus sp.]MDW8064678.1 aminotransferase class I/II-fold pyridoxal phosphate-dependent enzyme [Anaerolineae bacterium]
MSRVAERVHYFTESVIREMTRWAQHYGAINLAQGFPDFPAPDALKEAAAQAILKDYNQYAITWGSPRLRVAIAEKYRQFYGMELDPERHITVCCGATECMIATLLALLNPGDEVIIFEPFYENYGPDTWISGAKPVYVPLRPPSWTFDPDELCRAFSNRTRAIILNTPHNPTGHVFSEEELRWIAELCQRYDAYAVTDEIYEHIVYDGHRHIPIATLPGMWERTITISGMSKSYAVTGWRVAWCIAPEDLTEAIRKVHDFLTVGAPAPLQEASVVALQFPMAYYEQLGADYDQRRRLLVEALEELGFEVWWPQGAYYVMADFRAFGTEDDTTFAMRLVREIGVAVVPGSSFYARPDHGRAQVRFAFCKREETLREAVARLWRLRA